MENTRVSTKFDIYKPKYIICGVEYFVPLPSVVQVDDEFDIKLDVEYPEPRIINLSQTNAKRRI
jgi:hypothetical protein